MNPVHQYLLLSNVKVIFQLKIHSDSLNVGQLFVALGPIRESFHRRAYSQAVGEKRLQQTLGAVNSSLRTFYVGKTKFIPTFVPSQHSVICCHLNQ